MNIKRCLTLLIVTAIAITSVFATETETEAPKVPKPVTIIKVEPVVIPSDSWIINGRSNAIAVPVGIQYRNDSGELNDEIGVTDRMAPNFGLFMEFADEVKGKLYPAGRFEFGAAFYPLYPHSWKDCGFHLMTDLSLGMKVMVHDRPMFADGRLDLYVGVGFEFSLFNPRSDQNEVQNAFGHEMGKLGIFDESAGLNATVGIGYDVAKNDHGKWTAFLESEFRTLMPFHVYIETHAGMAWHWGY